MKRTLRLTFVLLITTSLLVLFVRGANLREVVRHIGNSNIRQLALALTASSFAYVLRAKRWQFLLRPLGKTRFATAFRATAIGFAATFLLPGRTGEVLRPYLLSRREGFSAMATFATVVVERLLDTIGVLILFAAFLLVGDPGHSVRNSSLLQTMTVAGVAAGGLAIAGFVGILFMSRAPERTVRIVRRLARVLPSAFVEKIVSAFEAFTVGFTIIRRPLDAVLALAGAFPLWLCNALAIWSVSEAFQLGVPPSGAFLLLMLLVVGVAVPTPGGVGSYHYAFRLGATTFFAAADDRAVAAAVVLHAISFLPITLVGLIFAAREGLTLGSVPNLTSMEPNAPIGSHEQLASANLKPSTN